jgi:hypothetical protein
MAVIFTHSLSTNALPRFNSSEILDPTSVPKKSTQRETFSVTGLTTDMKPLVRAASLEAGLTILSVDVPAIDTLAIDFINPTNAPIDPASQTFEITAF